MFSNTSFCTRTKDVCQGRWWSQEGDWGEDVIAEINKTISFFQAGKTLKDVPQPETKINSHDATLVSKDDETINMWPLLQAGIQNFKADRLKDVQTEVKGRLPTAEEIAAKIAGNWDWGSNKTIGCILWNCSRFIGMVVLPS